MPKGVYILMLLIVACCRIVSEAAPFLQNSPEVLVTWHDQECDNEDSEVEKAKQEAKEDTWLAQIELIDRLPSISGFIVFSDNSLLKHSRKPVIPPPNVA